MATKILQVISEYCSVYVDDIRLKELANTDKPLYAREMYGYFLPAISLFNIPAEMQDYLIGTESNPKFVEPRFDSAERTVAERTDEDLTISLGSEYADYEICGCRVKRFDEDGNITIMPREVAYDAETGSVTVYASEENPIGKGDILDFDFYKDGEFANTLSRAIMNILGMCFQVVWQDRFNTDWLSMVNKVEDKSFHEQNRANKQRADTERMEMLMRKLAGEMRRYDQNAEYKRMCAAKPINI